MEATGKNKTPDFYRHVYRICNKVKSYTTYELAELPKGLNFLSDFLRIEPYQGKSQTKGVSICSRLRTTSNWTTSKDVTGLRPTDIKGVYYGDRLRNDIKTLLIFRFMEKKNGLFGESEIRLNIDVYPHYYPRHKEILQNIINTYKTN
ncbi:hypothetical protein [Flavobacterium xinjiangense]|uniref:Uncharacterized protein n=1 Tax=Flavobacterium xinjiangense TaxID=178356 RepID=A0A1M7FNE6_9FLAO|nr:hypothetical protein [Flavobacterium xinjiangense]SHM05177.1 hypothetical protein SAMN05216269_102202 [Flavobacterium xinjiangense]